MSVVVSANYRDRTKKNWLIRQEIDPLEKYKVSDRVVIKNFQFCESYSGEVGFGCNIVAVGELEETPIDTDKLVRVRFTGLVFVEDASGLPVSNGRALVLDETGMYYVPA